MPVEAHVEFRCIADARRFLYGGLPSQFRMLVPSDTLVMMKVSQDGYEDWVFSRDGSAKPLQLRPGETLNIAVKLRKTQ